MGSHNNSSKCTTMFKYIEKISVWFLLLNSASLITNLSLRSEIQDNFLDLVKKECGGQLFECSDGNTCCPKGDTCCPDPSSSSGTGCCPGVTNGICCDGYCCFQGLVCQDGGCALGDVDVTNGTHSLWKPGVPFIKPKSLP